MEYLTHTNPRLTLRFEESGENFLVTFTGDKTKKLYEGPDQAEARRIYHETVSQYEERRKIEGDYRRFDISFESFKDWYDNGYLDPNPERLAGILSRVEPDRQEEAVRLALVWAQKVWGADAAWETIHLMPPFVTPHHRPDSQKFTDLLFPNVPRASQWEPKGPKQFWQWQQEEGKKIPARQFTNRDTARDKWIERCSQSKELRGEIEDLSDIYQRFVRFLSSRRQVNFSAYVGEARYKARQGVPDCGHVQTIRRCEDSCTWFTFDASEAHYGWHVRKEWKPSEDVFGQVLNSDSCECCQRKHNYVPEGEARCHLCAEALYWTKSEVVAAKYGGWSWLIDAVRDAAEALARERDAGLEELEKTVGLAPREWSGPEIQRWERQQRLGGNPWRVGEGFAGPERVAVFYVPVPLSNVDLKSDVRQRLTAIFDSLWQQIGLTYPKSSGSSPTRTRDWARYLSWLWQRRIEGKALRDLDNAESPREPDAAVTERTLQHGIDLAIATLSAS